MIFAIDSGGTKTKILLAESDGTIVDTRNIQGFGTADDPQDEPLPLLAEALAKMGTGHEITHVTVNLGGKNTKQVTNCIRNTFPTAMIQVFRESSGVIGEYIRESAGADIIFFSGTGCISLARGKKGCFVLDGWGRDIGDLGSGYDIGLTAIRQALAELEGTEPLSLLAQEITGETEPFPLAADYAVIMKKRDTVRAKILPLERAKIAAITKTVYRCTLQNDKAAGRILETAGKKLGETAVRAIHRVGKRETVTIAFCGGVSETKDFWLASFEKTVRNAGIKATVLFPKTDFAQGALDYTIKGRDCT